MEPEHLKIKDLSYLLRVEAIREAKKQGIISDRAGVSELVDFFEMYVDGAFNWSKTEGGSGYWYNHCVNGDAANYGKTLKFKLKWNISQ